SNSSVSHAVSMLEYSHLFRAEGPLQEVDVSDRVLRMHKGQNVRQIPLCRSRPQPFCDVPSVPRRVFNEARALTVRTVLGFAERLCSSINGTFERRIAVVHVDM